ncbi:MAG: threonylcarbamoyl-AMP synthase [Gammaproteobacteria bacterium]|nr:MAG: threonylcarbamoyl-AMP synthase [Gammaproteobacteria bacterium]
MQYFQIHPDNPQKRLIRQAVDILEKGGVIVYPTDSCYAYGCTIGNKSALERIRKLRDVDKDHHFTLVCRDLSEIANYAKITNPVYRLLKMATPGPYTFIMEATRSVPKRLLHPKRKSIGLRVPDHPVVSALLSALGHPLMSATLIAPGEDLPMSDPDEIRSRLEKHVDLLIDCGSCGVEPTTVVDLTSDYPQVIRQGRGDAGIF